MNSTVTAAGAATSTGPPRTSRRSFPNLHLLDIAPLSQNFPLEASSSPLTDTQAAVVSSTTVSIDRGRSRNGEDEDEDDNGSTTPTLTSPRSSYIQGRSAPTTPGILSLSRSSSRHRRHAASRQKQPIQAFAHESYFPPSLTSITAAAAADGFDDTAGGPVSVGLTYYDDGMKKAKSEAALLPRSGTMHSGRPAHHNNNHNHHNHHSTAAAAKKRHHRRTHTTTSLTPLTPDSWLHRAGLLIASEAAGSKGQSWLASRASSTSLDAGALAALSSPASSSPRARPAASAAADEPPTPRWPAGLASHPASARTSRRGSRAELFSPPAAAFPAGAAAVGMEPDFVSPAGVDADADGARELEDGEDDVGGDEDDAEAEVARLAVRSARASSAAAAGATAAGAAGGGWVDRLIGWTLFRVAEDGEERSSSDEEGDGEDGAFGGGEVRDGAGAGVGRGEGGKTGPGLLGGADMEREVMRRRREMDEVLRRVGEATGRAATRREERGRDAGEGSDGDDEDDEEDEEAEGGAAWRDAAWLLGVAGKVMFS